MNDKSSMAKTTNNNTTMVNRFSVTDNAWGGSQNIPHENTTICDLFVGTNGLLI